MTRHKNSIAIRLLLMISLAALSACNFNNNPEGAGSTGVGGTQDANAQGSSSEGHTEPSTCKGLTPELQWTRTFQGGQIPGGNRAYAVAAGKDALFLAGQAMYAAGQAKAIMLRVSKKDGNVEWTRWRKPDLSEGGSSATATVSLNAAGIVFVGKELVADSSSDSEKGTGIWVEHLGRDGELLWEDQYTQTVGTKNAEARAVARTASDSVVVLGALETAENPVQSLWLRRYNSGGAVEWSGIDTIDGVDSAAEGITINDRDGMMYLTGSSTSSDPERRPNLMLAAYSSQGARLSHTVDNAPKALDSGLDIAQLGNGDLVFVGIKRGPDGKRRAFLRRQQKDGRTLWTSDLDDSNGASAARALVVDRRDNIYVVGTTEVNNSGALKSWIAIFDPNGNESWRREFSADQEAGASRSVSFDDIAIDEDCRLFVFGTKDEENNRNFLLSAFRI